MARGLFSREVGHKRRMDKLKSNPVLWAKYKKDEKERRKKRKDKINEWNRNYRKEMREVALSINTCTVCFKEKDNPEYKICSKCRERKRRYGKNKNKETS